jgi:hypothetical protein
MDSKPSIDIGVMENTEAVIGEAKNMRKCIFIRWLIQKAVYLKYESIRKKSIYI